MSNLVRASELVPALRTLLGYLSDLRRTKFEQGSTKLRLVINYAQKDEVVRALSERLRGRIPTEALHERTKEVLDVPPDPRDRVAFFYTLLYHIKQGWKLELRELLSRSSFAGAGLDARWESFQKQVVDPMVQGFSAVTAHVEAAVAARSGDELVDPDLILGEAIHALAPSGATYAPLAAPAPAAAPAAAAFQVPAQLDRSVLDAVEASGLRDAARGDLLTDAALLEVELSKRAPDAARLEALLADLETAPAGVRSALLGRVGAAVVRLVR